MLSTKADSVRLYKIRKVITELSGKEGRGTELVSLYIPPKKPIHEVVAYLRNEWGTAGNIKSDTTRNHVQDALTKTMQRLKLYRETPDNGLVIFCGALMTNGPGSEVIVLREITPPKAVKSFLYMCVAPETNVLMEDGTQKTIGALKSSWTEERVMSWDAERKQVTSGPVRDYLNAPVDGRRTYRLTVESGRSIVATEDHPFQTPKGWMRLGHLNVGDLVCVLPVPDATPEKGVKTGGPAKFIVTEESLRKMRSPPKNIGLAIRRLKQHGLLPLTSDSAALPAIARILGHLFSDGSLFSSTEKRTNGSYTYFTADFCVGSKADEDAVRNDIARLGSEAPFGYPTTYTMNIEGRSYTGQTIHVKLRDAALCALLRVLGAPIGEKVVKGTKIPSWIIESPLGVQREFLAAYLGGDGTSPRIQGRGLIGQSGVGFHRIVQKKESGLSFARQIESLLGNFGIVVDATDYGPGYTRKDGNRTVEIWLRFELSEENILKLCHGIGIRYCSRKAAKANMIGEYLKIKSELRAKNRETMARARQMRAEGLEAKQIGSSLMLTKGKAIKWAEGRVKSPLVKASQLPAFEEWLKIARTGLEEPLLWESVSAIQEEPIPDVRDLTVENSNHSFFANGFLVHNCDDHFHIEYLKDMLKEEKVYGLLSIDANDVGIGVLSGESFEIANVMTSGISGKTRKGGQCVGADTLVQLEDGRLVSISNLTPRSRIASYNFWKYAHGMYECADTFSIVPKAYYVVETTRPKMKISATGEHRFFTIAKDGGVSTIEASNLKPGAKVLISRRLQEPLSPSLSTGFPAAYRHHVTPDGRDVLKKSRLDKGVSQSRVARALGLHQTEISQLERGERDLSWEKLRPIIELLYRDVAEFSCEYVETVRTMPEHFTPELLQLLGYLAGDGNAGKNRVCLYEYRMQVAKAYADLAKVALSLDYAPIRKVERKGSRSFAKHRYLETRIYSKDFVDGLRQQYPELVSTASRAIPERIHRLDNAHLAYFVRGLFDAEAHARKRRRVALAMKSALLIRQLQMLLQRFGIIASYSTYVNRFGSTMHVLDISDYDSLEAFHRHIGFTANDKQRRLEHGIREGRRPQSYHGVPAMGSWVDKKAKEFGIRRKQFHGITNFFHDRRGVSPRVFQRVIGTFEDELAQARGFGSPAERIQLLEETVSQLRKMEGSELILVAVKKVSRVKNSGKERFIDIELPSTRSFIGNGFVLHNSARRYERGREMELTYFYHRVADHANRIFMEEYKVTGLVVGGPGYTKEDFLKTEFLNYQLRKNLVAVLDTAYAGREGVRELVDKAADKLQDVRLFEEKKLVQRFLGEVNKANGLAVYGLPRIIDALNKSNVETILVSDDIDTVRISATCKNCQTLREKFVSASKKTQATQDIVVDPCSNCGSKEFEVDETDIVDLLEERAIQVGAKVEVISSGTEEGAMLKSFGGAAAFLRYRPAGT